MYGKNIYEKRILTTVVVAAFLIAAPAMYTIFQSADSTSQNALQGNIGLGGTIGQVWVTNGSVYKSMTITGTGSLATNSISFTMPDNFTGKHIVIFLNNPTYDTKGMLNSSYLFNTLNVQASVTGYTGHYNISSAYFVIGTQFNSTSLKAMKDKAINNPTLNETVYSTTVNHLNKTEQLSYNDAGSSKLTATPGIILNFNSTLKASTGTNTIKVTVTQDLQHANSFNLLYFGGVLYSIMGIISIVGVVVGMPRIGGRP